MASQIPPSNPNQNPTLYPKVAQSNPDPNSSFLSNPAAVSSSSSLYPSVDTSDLDNLVPVTTTAITSQQEPAVDETLLHIPGAMLHLIDTRCSIELSTGDFYLHRLSQGPGPVVLFASVSSTAAHDSIQWPVTRDTAAVKLDSSHYFFSLRVPDRDDNGKKKGKDSDPVLLNYGLTLASRGQESLLTELDELLQAYCSFSVHKVNDKDEKSEVLDVSLVEQITALEVMEEGPKKEMMEERSAAYWTTLAPNVEDYSGCVAKGIAKGSGQVVKGIIWCGDVAVERIKWGNELLKERMAPGEKPVEVSPETLRRIKRVQSVSRMSEKVATGVLTGVVKISGYFTRSVASSKVGKKVIGLIPGEIVLASLDGFGKICDAVEVAGKNVLSTSSTATTRLVSHRYGEQAAEATSEGLTAAGHAVGTTWTVFKIRKAIDPRCAIKPTALAKSAANAAAEIRAKQGK